MVDAAAAQLEAQPQSEVRSTIGLRDLAQPLARLQLEFFDLAASAAAPRLAQVLHAVRRPHRERHLVNKVAGPPANRRDRAGGCDVGSLPQLQLASCGLAGRAEEEEGEAVGCVMTPLHCEIVDKEGNVKGYITEKELSKALTKEHMADAVKSPK